MSEPIYKPVADGVYNGKEDIITVGPGRKLAVHSKKPPMMMTWHGDLPDSWRLCEAVADPNALAVPIDDIERILREHDSVYGFKRESNLMVRRVQRWLDALPRATEDKQEARAT